jgi:nicotinamide-nucleotide amidase
MKAEIISIGDELLIGQVVNTNASWMAEQLNMAGIKVNCILAISDQKEQILETLKIASKRSDVLLLTGGLGPTKDDITKKTLCEFYDSKLVFDEDVFEDVKSIFGKRGFVVSEVNKMQAEVPNNCTPIRNKNGTAPGMWFEKDDTIFVSVPGVPFEMKYLVEHEILPRLLESDKTKAIYHKTVLTQGIPESMLAVKLEDWENALPENIKLAYLPNPMSVRLRLSAMGNDKTVLRNIVEEQIKKLQQIIPESIFGFDKETMAEVIGRMLKSKGKKLAVAESCTGGFISHLITSIPGSSHFFNGSVTAYSNQIKENVLGVDGSVISKFGAVSEQVAKEMAIGAKRVLNSDYAVATTGIAGPAGGTDDKPVGTVWIAIAGKNRVFAKKFVFGNNRERNIIRSSQTALQILRRVILEEL